MSQYLDKDGASRIAENFLSKQAEQNAILQNLQFDLKEAEHALVKTIQGPAPLNIRALTRPLDDYRISGNTIQNGTPTPSDPVDAVGCGVWDETQQSYKLPLTVNDTEYPIYLGQVPTTRRIKKLVLDGTESTWLEWSGLNLFRVPDTLLDYRAQKDGAICDSLPLVMRDDLTTNSFCWSSGTVGEFIININNYNLADLRTYLSSNPITIWYVLAEPETAVVNEQLMKIGDYADTITMAQAGVEISTTKGFNAITTDTAVLPSIIEVKGVINNA